MKIMRTGLGNAVQPVEKPKNMAKLEEAAGRLDKALNRLGAAVETQRQRCRSLGLRPAPEQLAAVEHERDNLRAELERLRVDHRKLSAALHEAQENYAAAQVVNEAVAGRLDITIGQIKSMLEA